MGTNRGSKRTRTREAVRALHVLVTNDDGVHAPGLDAIVTALSTRPGIEVSVVAPATNQTGASAAITTTTLDARRATTRSGHAAVAVAGTPVDTVLLGVHRLLATPPDLVVAGVNEGPNLADFVAVSGTVAAALAAADLGIPAVAASQGLTAEMDYHAAASFVAELVERFRDDRRFRASMRPRGRRRAGVVLNVNFPACEGRSVRGVRLVGLGRLATVAGYVPAGSEVAGGTHYEPTVVMGSVSESDCASTLRTPATDLEAFNHGFASVTPLAPDLTRSEVLERFRFIESRRGRPARRLRPKRRARPA